MEPGSYLQPHRHFLYPKPELFVALRGTLAVIIFADAGEIENTYVLSPMSMIGLIVPTVIAVMEPLRSVPKATSDDSSNYGFSPPFEVVFSAL
jgi:hypothetical protein